MAPEIAAKPLISEEYEDLLGLWADLELTLSVLLARPGHVRNFEEKLRHIDGWLQELVQHDVDASLYLMFQLASTSTVGYSASHALVCATLCHIMAREFALCAPERDALVLAALTMNISMTHMQDELALQREAPSAQQMDVIDHHGRDSQNMLRELDISNELYLGLVGQHHGKLGSEHTLLANMAPAARLLRILGTIDRYAAMTSPRKSRPGRSATESVRALVGMEIDQRGEVGMMLIRTVGPYPPGTFVRLDDGTVAIVLRRSNKPNKPLVASVLDSIGAPLTEPQMHHTSLGKPHIKSSVASMAVSVELNHRIMVRLGLYASRPAVPLVSRGAV